nr:MAG TPA: hypothetical protein [Caudoviricetes sp.]
MRGINLFLLCIPCPESKPVKDGEDLNESK